MKANIQAAVAQQVMKEITISPTGKALIISAMVIQFPFVWLPFVTQIATAILLGIALSHIRVRQVNKK